MTRVLANWVTAQLTFRLNTNFLLWQAYIEITSFVCVL